MSDTPLPIHPSNAPTPRPKPDDPATFLSDAMALLRHLKLTPTDDGSVPRYPVPVGPEPWPTINGYEILGELGRGGMGVVYKARQQGLNRVVALKMILAATSAGSNELLRFLAEAEAVAAVRHPNVVEVYELGECGGRPFFAMEFVPGGSLAEVLRPKDADPRRLAPVESARLMAAVARGVDAAHEAGIVHRDLKPANILLIAEFGTRNAESQPKTGDTPTAPPAVDSTFRMPNSTFSPKVSDFGLAKRLSSELTRTQAVMGTPAYMAPEQAGGKAKFVGPAADVYALGVILYDCLTGTVPFTADEPWAVLAKVLEETPKPPSAHVPGLPRDLELICLKCLEKEPHHRYPTAAALADDLEAFADGRAVSVRPTGAATRLWRWGRRNPTQAALAGVLLALALIVPPVVIWNRGELAASAASEAGAKIAQAEAEKLADVRALFALESDIRRRSARRPTRWTWSNRDDLARAAPLAAAGGLPLTDLRTEGVAVALAADLRAADPPAVVKPLTMAVATTRPDGMVVAVGEFKASRVPKLSLNPEFTATVVLFDAGTGAAPRQLICPAVFEVKKGGQDGVRSLAYSPDGKRLFAGMRGGAVYRFDLDSESQKPTVKWSSFDTPGDQLAVSPDGATVYGRTDLDPKFFQWDAKTGKVRATFATDAGTRAFAVEPVTGDVIASDGSHLYRLSPDLKLRGPKVPVPEGHPLLLSFECGGRLLVGTCGDTIVLFDPATLLATTKFFDPDLRRSSHESRISALAGHPSGGFLATASSTDDDRQVKVWEVASGRRVAAVGVPGTGPIGLAWSGDGSALYATAPGQVQRFAFAAPAAQRFACFHPSVLEAASLSPDAARVAAVGQATTSDLHRTLVVTTWGGKTTAAQLPGSRIPGRSGVAFDPRPGATRVLASARARGLFEWNPDMGAEQMPPHADVEANPPNTPLFAPDGSALWLTVDSSVSVWDGAGRVKRGAWNNVIGGWMTGLGSLDALAIGPTRVVAGGRNGSVFVLRQAGETVAMRTEFPNPGDPVSAVALSPDESLAAAGTRGGKVRLCRLADQAVTVLDAHAGGTTGASFHPDGTLLATGGKDRAVKVWRRAGGTFELLFAAADLPSPVLSVEFSRAGDTLLVLLMNEHAVRVWDVAQLRTHLNGLKLGW